MFKKIPESHYFNMMQSNKQVSFVVGLRAGLEADLEKISTSYSL